MTTIPPADPPSYDQSISENDMAARYGEGARFLRHQTTESPAPPEDNSDHDSLLNELQEEDDDDEQEVRREMDQFEIDDYDAVNNSSTTSVYSRASSASQRIARNLNKKFIGPVVRRLVDPVAHFLNNIGNASNEFLARFGNPLMFKRLIYVFTVAILVFVVVSTDVVPADKDSLMFSGIFHDHGQVREFLGGNIRQDLLRDRLEYMSSMTHTAGTAGDLTLAKYIEQEFLSFGINPVEFNGQTSYLTFPGEGESDMQLRLTDNSFEASLYEPQLYPHLEDAQKPVRPYLALAASGEAEGPVVYANYGSKDDFKALTDAGINLKGTIVFMRYGKLSPGLKVMLAEKEGAVGAVLFSEKVNNETLLWPDGPDYPYDAVQRDHVGVSAITPGDILTPGWSAMENSRTIDYSQAKNVPKIPAIPVSWSNVKPFLETIKGNGMLVSEWNNGMPELDEWWSGDETSPAAYLRNTAVVKENHEIWNVLGKIEGQEQTEKAIIIGSQRDAFCYGAVEPMSGTTILLELARVFSLMNQKYGWIPLRSVYFASWDATEQNLAGSTEWVEFNADELRRDALIYINLDAAVSGANLKVSAHPALESVIQGIMSLVNLSGTNDSLKDVYGDKKLDSLDSNGDYLPFVAHAGVVSVNLAFEGDVYPRHSCFDSFDWMIKYGDPEFTYHKALADLVSLLILKYSDEPVVEFNVGAYGQRIHDYAHDLERYAKSFNYYDDQLDFYPLHRSADSLIDSSVKYTIWLNEWINVAREGEPPILTVHRLGWNTRLTELDKHMLDRNGAPQRNWFKHVLFGPQLWHPVTGGYEWNTFPGIRDSIEMQDWIQAAKAIDRASALMSYAADKLIN